MSNCDFLSAVMTAPRFLFCKKEGSVGINAINALHKTLKRVWMIAIATLLILPKDAILNVKFKSVPSIPCS